MDSRVEKMLRLIHKLKLRLKLTFLKMFLRLMLSLTLSIELTLNETCRVASTLDFFVITLNLGRN